MSFCPIRRFASLAGRNCKQKEISPRLGYILLVCALARLISASPPLVAKFSFTAFATANKVLRALVRSKSPIVLRSNLKSNLAKFINLASNFAHRDPHLENVNLKTCGATAPDKTAHSAATSHVQWSRWGFLHRYACNCKQTGEGLLLAALKESAS